MNFSRRLTTAACVVSMLAPVCGFAAGTDQTTLPDPYGFRTDMLHLAQRRTNRTQGDTLVVVGAIILFAGLGSDSGTASRVLTLGAGGFLIGLGFQDGPPTDPGGGRLSLGFWRGNPTASYTLFKF